MNRGFSLSILYCFIGKFERLHRGKPKTSAPFFKNFEGIPSKPGAFDVFRQAKV